MKMSISVQEYAKEMLFLFQQYGHKMYEESIRMGHINYYHKYRIGSLFTKVSWFHYHRVMKYANAHYDYGNPTYPDFYHSFCLMNTFYKIAKEEWPGKENSDVMQAIEEELILWERSLKEMMLCYTGERRNALLKKEPNMCVLQDGISVEDQMMLYQIYRERGQMIDEKNPMVKYLISHLDKREIACLCNHDTTKLLEVMRKYPILGIIACRRKQSEPVLNELFSLLPQFIFYEPDIVSTNQAFIGLYPISDDMINDYLKHHETLPHHVIELGIRNFLLIQEGYGTSLDAITQIKFLTRCLKENEAVQSNMNAVRKNFQESFYDDIATLIRWHIKMETVGRDISNCYLRVIGITPKEMTFEIMLSEEGYDNMPCRIDEIPIKGGAKIRILHVSDKKLLQVQEVLASAWIKIEIQAETGEMEKKLRWSLNHRRIEV